MAKAKRKLSKYNLHVRREMKKGRSMSQAAKSWNKGNPKPRKQKRKATAKRKTTPKPRSTRQQTQTFRLPLIQGFRARIQNRMRIFRR